MTSGNGRPKRTEDMFPDALKADRAFLVDGDMSRQPCVLYFRKSSGDDFRTQVLRCLQYARRAGLRLDTTMGVEGVYYDEDKSGRLAKRPGYDRMMADVMLGKLKGRYIVVRDQDRLSRRESSVLEEYHVITAKANVHTFDSTGREIKDDITTAIMGVQARIESKTAGTRHRARMELRAIEGLPPASRVRRTGYTHGYKAIMWEEAKWLRRAMNKTRSGQSLSSLVRRMYKAGITRPNGKPYRTTDLSRLLSDPVYAALRTFGADIEMDGRVIPKGEVVAEGKWPPIFTKEEHLAMKAILGGNQPWVTDKTPKHLLIGILVCGECGTRMGYSWKYGKPHKDGTRKRHYQYHCQRMLGGCGKVSRNADALEAFFEELTIAALRKVPQVAADKPVDITSAEIARLERKIADSVQAFKNDDIDIATLADVRRDSRKKIDALRREQQEAAEKVVTTPITSAEDFEKSTDIALKRDTIRRFFGVVGVKPAGAGKRFSPDQLVFSKKVA